MPCSGCMEARNAAHPEFGLWGWIILAGFGLLALGRLISLLAHFDDVDGADRAPLLFSVVGAILLSGAMLGAGLFLRSASLAIRAALVIAGSFLLVSDTSSLVGALSRIF